jgi:hypothetical protein
MRQAFEAGRSHYQTWTVYRTHAALDHRRPAMINTTRRGHQKIRGLLRRDLRVFPALSPHVRARGDIPLDDVVRCYREHCCITAKFEKSHPAQAGDYYHMQISGHQLSRVGLGR